MVSERDGGAALMQVLFFFFLFVFALSLPTRSLAVTYELMVAIDTFRAEARNMMLGIPKHDLRISGKHRGARETKTTQVTGV